MGQIVLRGTIWKSPIALIASDLGICVELDRNMLTIWRIPIQKLAGYVLD
jgi:hypothetical protein